MSERDTMLRKSRKTKNELDISSYKNLRNRVNIMVRNAVSTYNKNLLSVNKNNPRKFWSVIKSIYKMKGNSEITSHTFKINGEETSNKLSIADGFSNYEPYLEKTFSTPKKVKPDFYIQVRVKCRSPIVLEINQSNQSNWNGRHSRWFPERYSNRYLCSPGSSDKHVTSNWDYTNPMENG